MKYNIKEPDMRDKIRNGRYEPVLEYPKKPSKPILNLKHTSEEASAYAGLLKRWEHDMELWEERLSEYRASHNRLEDAFKRDALEYCGIQGHPKADLAFQMAKDNSGGGGRISILDNLEELSDLLI